MRFKSLLTAFKLTRSKHNRLQLKYLVCSSHSRYVKFVFNLLECLLKQLKVHCIQIEHSNANELKMFVGLVINTSNLTIFFPRCPLFPWTRTQPTVLQAMTCHCKTGINVFTLHLTFLPRTSLSDLFVLLWEFSVTIDFARSANVVNQRLRLVKSDKNHSGWSDSRVTV